MHYYFKHSCVTMLLAFAGSFVNAVPLDASVGATAKTTGKTTFSIKQVENPAFRNHTGPRAYAHSLRKWGAPAELLAAAGAATGSASATPISNDQLYLLPVQIGTPAQTLYLDLDTGSSDLWVFSSDTPTSQSSGHAIYKPGSSSTASLLSGATWKISYADGSGANGIVYKDKVSIGGATVTTQAVESAQSASASFIKYTSNSGLLGLAFSTLNTVSPTRQNTFFANLMGSLASPVFTADLKRAAAGTYNFGYINTTGLTSGITYVPVSTAKGYWEINSSGYAIGTGAFVATTIDTLVDTGSSLLLMDPTIVKAYYAQVSGASLNSAYNAYTFPCASTLPSFTFGVGTYRGVIPGTYLNYGRVSSTVCYGGLQSNGGVGYSIWGDILLKSQFVVFNGQSLQIGFASKPT